MAAADDHDVVLLLRTGSDAWRSHGSTRCRQRADRPWAPAECLVFNYRWRGYHPPRTGDAHARRDRRRPDHAAGLPRARASATSRARCWQVTTAPQGYEGEGFPVRRAFAGVDLAAARPVHHDGPDGRGGVRAGRAQGHAVAPAPRLRDRHLHDRRRLRPPGQPRRRRHDHQRRHPVDDRRLRACCTSRRRRSGWCSPAASSTASSSG